MGLHLDELARAVTDPRTPADERADINGFLFKDFVRSLDFPDMDELRQEVGQLMFNQSYLSKAVRLQAYSSPTAVSAEVTGRGHASILEINEYGVVGGIGPNSRYAEKPLAGGFGLLRDAINNVEVIGAIIQTIVRFVLQFCQPEREKEAEGFQLLRKDGEKLTKRDEAEVARLEEWLLNCGEEFDPRKRKYAGRHDMQGYVARLLRDSLGADACPVETERSNSNKIVGLYNVPFDTIRLCTEEGYEGDDRICAVQVINDTPWVAYTLDDIIYEIRNPRTDLWVHGYGQSETEQCLKFWTAFLNTFNFNDAGMNRNSVPRGLLTLFGEYDRRQLNDFTRNLHTMLHGAMKRWNLPVLAAKTKEGGAQYTKIDQDFNEMFFAKWMSFLVSIPCAFWGIHPTEINIDAFSAQATSSLSGKDTGEKYARSRDKGLIPALEFLKRHYNTWILPSLTTKYRLEFVGLNEEDAQQKQERIKLSSTVDELREIDGRPPHPDPVMGAAPTNAAFMQLYMAQQQQQGLGQQAGGEDYGYPTDQDGEHMPYGGGQPAEGEHFHTLELGPGPESPPEEQQPGGGGLAAEEPMRLAKAHRPPVRRGGDFLVVIERDVAWA